MAKNLRNRALVFADQRERLTDKEILAAFPEASEILPAKLSEFSQLQSTTERIIKIRLSSVASITDDFSRWFWRRWIELNEGEELAEINKQITRLRRQLRILRGLPLPKGTLTDEIIQSAREVPVESLFNQQFRRAGSTLVGLCSFHEERTPSFHIYPKENRGWCFGCNQGGDVIGITMKLNNCGFKEAVTLLAGESYE